MNTPKAQPTHPDAGAQVLAKTGAISAKTGYASEDEQCGHSSHASIEAVLAKLRKALVLYVFLTCSRCQSHHGRSGGIVPRSATPYPVAMIVARWVVASGMK